MCNGIYSEGVYITCGPSNRFFSSRYPKHLLYLRKGDFSFLILRITRCIYTCICIDKIGLLELQRKWGYVLIEPFISLPSQKARYTYTLQYAICILYKEKGKLLRRRLSYVPAPFSRLNLITIDSLNLLLLRDGFTAVIISSFPPKKLPLSRLSHSGQPAAATGLN